MKRADFLYNIMKQFVDAGILTDLGKELSPRAAAPRKRQHRLYIIKLNNKLNIRPPGICWRTDICES
ncbi:hypothetical protein R50345_15915 [Paenibacillus sp. FSL R5-0345]|nr:hypothetical protein R50345_15915 [Paenibacillus sp. FSL R5-0345]